MKKLFVALMLMPLMASAGEVSVMGVTARQRYPWNGVVDIAVTFSGTSNDVGETICTFAATNGVQNAALSIWNLLTIVTTNGQYVMVCVAC